MYTKNILSYSEIGDNMKIGIAKGLYYYYYGLLYKNYFERLGFEVVESMDTNKEIIEKGKTYAMDEMCLSLKIFLGHVAYLQGRCDYLILPRIDNYGRNNQTCTNFLALYDIVSNLFDIPLLHYNIDLEKGQTEKDGLISIGKKLGKSEQECIKAYYFAKEKEFEQKRHLMFKNKKALESSKIKILMIAHSYNLYDSFIGKLISQKLKKMNIEIIYSDRFDLQLSMIESKKISKDLYWKESKECIGTIELVKDKVNGIIFLTTFPCGTDSLVNELVMRKIKLPYLNLIIDDMDADAGIDTRLESFIDILEIVH